MRAAGSACTVFALWASVAPFAQAGTRTLPIYVEESHAGSFYFLAETLALDEPHTLIHFDAHSDASAIMASDTLRLAVRRSASVEARAKMFQEWRRRGVIQCFNWIEPLMPRPIADVIWVPRAELDEAGRKEMEAKAREQIDAHEEASPRAEGPAAPHFRVADFKTWQREAAAWDEGRAVVASIDLDYFAATPDAEEAPRFEEMMDAVLRLRGLRALTFSLSSPYQPSKAKAERLLALALGASCRIVNAEVRFEPFGTTGPDKSLQALLLQRQGREVPAFDITKAGSEIRCLVLDHDLDDSAQFESGRLRELSRTWAGDPFQPTLTLESASGQLLSDYDGVFRPPPEREWWIRISPEPIGAKVRWKTLAPKETRYHIAESNFGFGEGAPRWIFCGEKLAAEGAAMERLPGSALTSFFHPKLRCGTVRVFAEVQRGAEIWRSAPVVIAVRQPGLTGLRAAWSEEFGLPYVFGATFLRRDFRSGAEACWGADCANFLIHGLRREGWRIPWGSAQDFASHLAAAAPEPVDGLICSLGAHIAGFWEDCDPKGVLDDNDLFVHQLEGKPEVLTLSALKKGRRAPAFHRMPERENVIRLLITGDIMLGRSVGERLKDKGDPFQNVRGLFKEADCVIGNLECAITTAPEPSTAKAYRFRAPPESAQVLQAAGVRALGLANNHSMDYGAPGLAETRSALKEAGIATCGGAEQAPAILEIKGRRIAIFSIFAGEAPQGAIGTTSAPDEFAAALGKAGESADFVIVLPHWGVENSRKVSDSQRLMARQWLQAGADLIAGSGPHVIQEIEDLPRGVAAYSLGNFVFDGAERLPEWNRGGVLEVWLDARTGRLLRSWMRPVVLTKGLPQLSGNP